MIQITPEIAIDESELREEFVRASGPGGQHVNKSATAVQLRFDAAASPSLPPDVRARLLPLAGSRATESGEIIIEAQGHRSQDRNRRDAIDRLVALIRQAAHKPKRRKRTRVPRAERRRRIEDKRRRGETKRTRGRVRDVD